MQIDAILCKRWAYVNLGAQGVLETILPQICRGDCIDCEPCARSMLVPRDTVIKDIVHTVRRLGRQMGEQEILPSWCPK
jgi:hypothetical protein